MGNYTLRMISMGEMSRSYASFARSLRRDSRRSALWPTVVLALLHAVAPATAPAFETGRSETPIRVNELEIPYRVFAIYALPGEVLDIGPADSSGVQPFDLSSDAGGLLQQSAAGWRWQAPDAPGIATVGIRSGADRIELNVVVLTPSTSVVDQRINGYRVGAYPKEPLNGNPLYLPPDGFIELTRDNADLELSPHFKLSQFPSKQSSEFPKYLVLREQLLLKLELLLEEVNHQGIAADTFTIMSGYRTPYYNAAIKNVPYSRHVFGGAADIYIDVAPRDDVMDDLNRDGRSDYRDAQRLYRIADTLFSQPRNVMLRGGLGVYRRNAAHGPFLHVDARQQRARWGVLP